MCMRPHRVPLPGNQISIYTYIHSQCQNSWLAARRHEYLWAIEDSRVVVRESSWKQVHAHVQRVFSQCWHWAIGTVLSFVDTMIRHAYLPRARLLVMVRYAKVSLTGIDGNWCMCVHARARTHTHTHTCTRAHAHTHTHTTCWKKSSHMHACSCTYPHTHTRTHTHTLTHTHTHTHTHKRTHTHTHTHTHKHTHTELLLKLKKPWQSNYTIDLRRLDGKERRRGNRLGGKWFGGNSYGDPFTSSSSRGECKQCQPPP